MLVCPHTVVLAMQLKGFSFSKLYKHQSSVVQEKNKCDQLFIPQYK